MKQPAFDLRSQQYKRNPYPALARLVEQGPMVKVKYPFIGSVWTTTTYEACNESLRDWQGFAATDGRCNGLRLPETPLEPGHGCCPL